MESSSNPSDNALLVLPDHRELSPASLLLLETHFRTNQDLSAASELAASMAERCSNSESNLAALHRKLTTLAVSWISRSFAAKSSIRGLTFDLQNLSLHVSRYVINKKIQNILGKDLPHLMKQVGRIETIFQYAEKTRQLEVLVGDLEDAVICVVTQNAMKMFSTKCVVNPSNAIDFGRKLEQLLQAVKVMNDIEDVLVCISKSKPQWHHLLKSVDVRVNNSFVLLRSQALSDHRALLASLGWPPKLAQIEVREIHGLPNPLVLMQREGGKSYSLSFQTLCALQHLQMRREERKPKNGGKEEQSICLWAIDELVSSIASRTEHHFLKWAGQPELMFALVHKITREFAVEVDNVLQPLIDKARLLSCSAKEAWVSSMVKMLSTFLVNKVFSVLSERYKMEKHMKSEVVSSWLNLVDLIIVFDKQMQLLVNSETGFFLSDSAEFPKCISVLSIFCHRPNWLKIWAKMELKDSWKKLKLELDDERTWLICTKQGGEFHFKTETQFLLSNREDYKAPPIADSALKFAWRMVERCRTMASTLCRIQFIRETASRFFLYFFKALVAHGKRVEPTATNPENDALIGVCGLINAASYCELKLQEWSDDAYFLELRLAESSTGGQGKNSDHYSCFFWEEIKTLAELETHWLMEVVSDVLYQFDILSLSYFQTLGSLQQAQWEFSPAKVSTAIELTVSADFVVALDTLRNRLCAIEMNLNQKDFLDLWRSIADGLDHFVSSKVTASDIRFCDERHSQFHADMEALFSVFGGFCVRPGAFFPGIRASLKV